MQYHLDTIGRWFDERYGFRHPEPLEGLVNFEFANAFYGDFDADGVGEVAFGEWADSDLAYDADVIYHEFGHSVFGRVVVTEGFLGADEYGREYAPGALNEGSADALALVHTGDPDVGEYAGRALFGEERPIRALGDLRRCPEDLYGEIHVDGEVWGSLMWQIQDRLGASVAADLAYGSLLAFPDELSWEAAGEALRATAEELAAAGAISPGERDAVIDLGEQSGVIGCGRAVDLLSGASPRQLLISASIFEEETFIPAGVQFSVEVPAGGSRLRFRITDWESSSDAIGWRLLARRGREVHHEVRRRSIGPWTVLLPQPWNFDLAIDGEGGDFELEIDRQGWISTSGEPYLDDLQVLRPGETYYFAIASRVIDDAVEFAQANVTVEADLLVDPSYRPPLPGSGCTGCQPEDDEPGFTLGLLLGLPWLLGLLGRRRQGAGGSSRAI